MASFSLSVQVPAQFPPRRGLSLTSLFHPPIPCILPFLSDDPNHHLRPHSGVFPSLSCIFHEDSGLARLGMSGHLSHHFLVSVPQGPSLSLSQADLIQALRGAPRTVRPDVALPCSTNTPGM